MSLVSWDPSYSVKVRRFDQEHQKLFDLMNALHAAMQAGKGRKVIGDIVSELRDYTITHFQAEEAQLVRANYPELAEHRQAHSVFVAKVRKMEEDVQATSTTNTVAALQFLKDWLTGHIRKMDQRYSDHLNAIGIS